MKGEASKLEKFKGIIPAFYACYDDNGNISKERTEALADYYLEKGVQGVYVAGSSGECIYHNLEERKDVLTHVANRLKGKMTLIAHVGAPSTRDSIILAQHAEQLGYDALSAIPPIYFKLSDQSVMNYWNDIIDSTSLDFIIYNIPQTTGYTLTPAIYAKMLENKKVIGVKNSSMPTLDIERFKRVGGADTIVFNGPDEQFVSGRMMGADGGIGGTYGAMPELYLKANELLYQGEFEKARALQSDINDIIIGLVSQQGHMLAVIKEILKRRGINVGGVRSPLASLTTQDEAIIPELMQKIDETITKYCN